MGALVFAVLAMIAALAAAGLAWMALCTAQLACGLADDALDSISLLTMSPDAIFVSDDGEEAEIRLERGH